MCFNSSLQMRRIFSLFDLAVDSNPQQGSRPERPAAQRIPGYDSRGKHNSRSGRTLAVVAGGGQRRAARPRPSLSAMSVLVVYSAHGEGGSA